GDWAFNNCSALESITIPDGVTSIGDSTFQNCVSLKTITIPDSITSIGDYAFDGCSILASVTIPNSVKSIGYSAFYGCYALTSVTIPDGVISIDTYAFNGCSSLKSITLPESVTSIGGRSFCDCSSLKSITIENADCEIYDSKDTISSKATIYGYSNSTAQAYAKKYDRTFIALDAPAETTTTTSTTTSTTSTSTSTTTTSTTASTSTSTTATTTTTAPENAELVIPVSALNMGESVTVTLKGEPNQKIEPEFDFSAADLNQDINNEINAAPEQLDENGEYEFVFEAPWDMNPFSIRIGYSGSPITYTVDYDRKKEEDSPVFTEGGDNWSFSNSKNYFGENYFLNAEYKTRLFEKLSNVEKETMKKKLQKKWGGSCFGMAITSILASNNILMPSDYQNGTNFLHDITAPPTEDTLSLINYYYFLQYTKAFQQEITNTRRNTNQENLENLIECVQDGSPTLLCFYYGVKGNQGHAVVA
ncbi:MAG: leucine-rich repeat domain-containing protein, partial [Oscillospiraceae bacterium]|nr:leucine-rich repeat domain-containing protein [Oscillospiraceae bacterium]